MLNEQPYEVIILGELELNAHNAKKPREKFLEDILNEYAKNGYKVSSTIRDIIIMENEKLFKSSQK